MKILRILIVLNALLFLGAGIGMVLLPYAGPLDVYGSTQEIPMLRSMGLVLGAFAFLILALSGLSLPGERRRLAFGLSIADLLIGIADLPIFSTGNMAGILLIFPFLPVIAGVLAWTAWRFGGTQEIAEFLPIPHEVQQSWLRQIGEAAVQEERNRLARDLHDSIKQQLFTVNVSTAAAQELWEQNPERAKAALVDVRRSAREAMVEMQALLHQLQPQALAAAGLVEALREQCEALGYRTGAEVSLELGETIPDDRLPLGAQETLFRIAQETLANVARHARASKVRVWLGRVEDSVLLRVEDDGQGFDFFARTFGMGLKNLEERAQSLRGILKIWSAPGSGTTISVKIPLAPPPALPPAPPQTPIEKELKSQSHAFYWLSFPAGIFLLDRPIPKGLFFYEREFLDASELVPLLLLSLGCFGVAVYSKWRMRSVLQASPEAAPASVSAFRYLSHRYAALTFLLATWWMPWYWRAGNIPTDWTITWLLAAFLGMGLAAAELVQFHRVSEIRHRWWSGLWTWPAKWGKAGYGIVFVVLVGIGFLCLKLVSWLEPIESILLLFGALTLGYVLMRQPRTGGAS